MAASPIDLLFVRRIDIIKLFVRRRGLRLAGTKEELRVLVTADVAQHGSGPLQEFLAEIADGGRRHFYFFKDCHLDLAHQGNWDERIVALDAQSIALTRQFLPDPNGPLLRFEFEQEREERQPYPNVPPPLELEDGSRVEYSAERIFQRPLLSYLDVNVNTGAATAAVAQQERAADYTAILGVMRHQMTQVTGFAWPDPASLQHLAVELSRNPNIHASEEKTKTASGSVQTTADNPSDSLDNDVVIREVRNVTRGQNAIMKLRCCWVRALHGPLSHDVTIWLNAWDNWLNLRQDATAADTAYVLNDIRNIL